MAEQLGVENGEKLQKVPFLKIVFCNIAPLHRKVNCKISYLGEINSILPGQMTEQLAVKVDLKNVTQNTVHSTQQQQHRHMEKLHYLL